MAIAITLKDYLAGQGVDYYVLNHHHSDCSGETAQMTHISGKRLAKAVVLEDEAGYLMAVIPANRRVHIGRLHRDLNRNLGLATEGELGTLFDDCEAGAVPPLGQAYGLETVVDKGLLDGGDVYFEAGDHCALIHLSGEQFRKLTAGARVGELSEAV